MSRRTLTITAVLAAISLGACAQIKPQDHAAHHPDGASVPVAAAPAASAPAPAAAGTGQARPIGSMNQMAGMDQHMSAMRTMHEKMAKASTPKEREALMGEHMKLMQECMGMMSGMGPGGGMGSMDTQRDNASSPATLSSKP